MRFDVATNFEDDLIERIAEFKTVKSVYGKLGADIVGGGRPTIVLPDISRKRIRQHIEICHKYGIEFNYLLNASCMDNRELVAGSHREIMGLVKQVKEDGVDSVTVGSPIMLTMVKEQFPELKVATSIFMNVNTISKIKHLEALGANEITLDHNFTRNFPLLNSAASISKKDLRLIANNVCLHECPYAIPSHANLLAHSSQSKHETKGFTLDVYTLLCGLEKLKDPAEFIMSDWIRPEDVKHYDLKNITLKITDRARTTDWLVKAVKAYSERKYNGNLFDIINYIGNNGYAQLHKGLIIKGALTGKAKVSELLKLEKATFLPEVYVENQALDGFLEHFKQSPCEGKTCYTGTKDYGNCRFCYDTAQKTVRINVNERQEAISLAEEVVESINSGRMFGK